MALNVFLLHDRGLWCFSPLCFTVKSTLGFDDLVFGVYGPLCVL